MAEPASSPTARAHATPAAGAPGADAPTRTRRPRPLERLNPATRLVVAVLLSIPLLVSVDWLSAAVSLVLEVLLLVLAGAPVRLVATRCIPLLLAGPLGAVSMALYGQQGGHTWWHWGPATVSDTSLRLAVAMLLRVFAIGLPAVVLAAGVDATRTADGLAQVLRLPSRFVLGTLAGLRMMGLFAEDWRTLGHARRARGLGDQGRLRRWLLMSFSLLVLAIRRGTRLATAMEAKGFGTDRPRTWARPSRIGIPDAVALTLALVVVAAALGASIAWGTFWPVWR